MSTSKTPNEPKKLPQKAARRVRIRLKTAEDVAKFMARCIRLTMKGEGDVNEGYKLCNMASQLLRALEVSALEERIAQLEENMGQGKKETAGTR